MVRKIIVLLAVGLTLFVNYLANALPLNGNNTGEISDSFSILLTPPGYVFAIWGIIYLGLIVYAVYPFIYKTNKKIYDKLFPWFLIQAFANISWIFLWHYEYFLATLVAMFIILGSLIKIYSILKIGESKRIFSEKVALEFPFSLYLGWISVATILNISIVLITVGWERLGVSEPLWSIMLIAAITLITMFMLIKRRDVIYSLVILWAFAGIIIKMNGQSEEIVWTLIMSILLIIATAVYTFTKSIKIKN